MSRVNPVGRLAAGIRFLTILPMGKPGENPEELRKSVPFFPLAGLLIGFLCSVLLYFPLSLLTGLVPSVLAVAILVGMSGGLHMDGLADTYDGFMSHTGRDRIMLIMKDSRVGTMGVLAVVFVIMIKVAAFSVLSKDQFLRVLLLTPAVGRWAMVQQICFMPYVRDKGLGSIFRQKSKVFTSIFSSVLSLGAVFALLGMNGLFCFAATAVVLLLFSVWCSKMIGGATGDTYGASSEISEAVFLLLAAFLLSGTG
ncbi:MAG: adenosylcobinamide-GDP ribazoletransferase [Candidatus Sabulitectum sp.]|nr:adenosylcobinamide-GDP ribazoletransferase [Candidatus Sabulitectum sp.]